MIKIGSRVKIIREDIWHQGYGIVVKEGVNCPGYSQYDFFIQTKSAGIIGYNRCDISEVKEGEMPDSFWKEVEGKTL